MVQGPEKPQTPSPSLNRTATRDVSPERHLELAEESLIRIKNPDNFSRILDYALQNIFPKKKYLFNGVFAFTGYGNPSELVCLEKIGIRSELFGKYQQLSTLVQQENVPLMWTQGDSFYLICDIKKPKPSCYLCKRLPDPMESSQVGVRSIALFPLVNEYAEIEGLLVLVSSVREEGHMLAKYSKLAGILGRKLSYFRQIGRLAGIFNNG